MRQRPHPGLIAALALAGLVAAALAGLAQAGGSAADLGPFWPRLAGTVRAAALQAILSTTVALALGAATAVALHRRPRFPGRTALVAAMGAAVVVPTIVVVFGLVAVFGRQGPAQALASALGVPPLPAIYGLHGVVLAHALMNAPLAALVLGHALAAIPPEQMRLAHMLRFARRDVFQHLFWPALRRELPGLAAFIFLLCFTSFAVVVTLGGGPRNATLEVAIYEALRLEVDFQRAAVIAAVQIALCLVFVAGFAALGASLPETGAGVRRASVPPPGAEAPGARLLDSLALACMALLIGPPLLSVLAALPALPRLGTVEIACAAMTSLALALAASALAVGLALMLAFAARQPDTPGAGRLIDLAVLALIGLPPFALVTGLFVLLRGLGGLDMMGLVLVPLVNALMALPFVYRLVAPPLKVAEARHGRLALSLRIAGLNRLRLIDGPLVRGPVLAAGALAMSLSLGDFGVIALFGGGDLVTLPYLMAERMGAYRMDEAGAVALLLVAIAVVLAFLAQRAARMDAPA